MEFRNLTKELVAGLLEQFGNQELIDSTIEKVRGVSSGENGYGIVVTFTDHEPAFIKVTSPSQGQEIDSERNAKFMEFLGENGVNVAVPYKTAGKDNKEYTSTVPENLGNVHIPKEIRGLEMSVQTALDGENISHKNLDAVKSKAMGEQLAKFHNAAESYVKENPDHNFPSENAMVGVPSDEKVRNDFQKALGVEGYASLRELQEGFDTDAYAKERLDYVRKQLMQTGADLSQDASFEEIKQVLGEVRGNAERELEDVFPESPFSGLNRSGVDNIKKSLAGARQSLEPGDDRADLVKQGYLVNHLQQTFTNAEYALDGRLSEAIQSVSEYEDLYPQVAEQSAVVIHSDTNCNNFMHDSDGEVSVLDLDEAHLGYIGHDIGKLSFHVDQGGMWKTGDLNEKRVTALLEGYTSERDLTKKDVQFGTATNAMVFSNFALKEMAATEETMNDFDIAYEADKINPNQRGIEGLEQVNTLMGAHHNGTLERIYDKVMQEREKQALDIALDGVDLPNADISGGDEVDGPDPQGRGAHVEQLATQADRSIPRDGRS